MPWAIRKDPQFGETRRVRKFAFIPVPILGRWVWLEQYEQEQRYEGRPELRWNGFYWSVVGGWGWCKKANYLLSR